MGSFPFMRIIGLVGFPAYLSTISFSLRDIELVDSLSYGDVTTYFVITSSKISSSFDDGRFRYSGI